MIHVSLIPPTLYTIHYKTDAVIAVSWFTETSSSAQFRMASEGSRRIWIIQPHSSLCVVSIIPSSIPQRQRDARTNIQHYNVSTVLEGEKWWPKLRAMLGTRTNIAYGIRCEAKVAGLNSMQTCVVCVHTSIYRLSCLFEENAQRREREKMTLYYQRP